MSKAIPEPRIFYYCYDHQSPTGGQKHTYRHVDILHGAGLDAHIFHPHSRTRLNWFDNRTPVVGPSEFYSIFAPERDIVVFPEDIGDGMLGFPGKKVIFNKNIFRGFSAFGMSPPVMYPYHDDQVIAVFTVSKHNADILGFTYPNLLVEQVPIEIDPGMFFHKPLVDKRPLIMMVPKALDTLASLYHCIISRGRQGLNRASSFEWILANNMTEREISERFRDALLVIFLSEAEGKGRIPLEAMASGCFVLSCDLPPMTEFVPPQARFMPNDIVGMARYVEALLELYPTFPASMTEAVEVGRMVAAEFSLEEQRKKVLDAWGRILERAASTRI
jgi:hypothetical protein